MTGKIQQQIHDKLMAAFSPEVLNVVDESHLHAGHAGAPEGGQSHFHVAITASQLAGLSRIARQRAINKVLADELAGPVHALRMTVR